MTEKEIKEKARQLKNEYQRELRHKDIERDREYKRNWRKNNPDKVKASQARYWERKAIAALEAEQQNQK